jgi:CBS domain-containing protein
MQNNPVSTKLHSIKLSEMVGDQSTIYSVKGSNSLEEVVKILSSKKIHSCPVIGEDGNCSGVIDMLDIVSYVLLVAPLSPKESGIDDPIKALKDLEMASRAMSLKEVSAIMNKSGKDTYVPLEMDNETTLAVNIFAGGIHRAPVVDAEGKLTGTLSQSTIVKWFIEQAKTYLKDFSALSLYLSDLGLGSGGVVAVTEDTTVLEVLKTLDKNGVSAVPVVDGEGKLVGNFSAVDLKEMYTEKWPSFQLPVKEYLEKHSKSSLVSESLDYQGSTLQDVLNFFDTHPFHRVWVVTEGKPVGVVSHTDIMTFLRDYQSSS